MSPIAVSSIAFAVILGGALFRLLSALWLRRGILWNHLVVRKSPRRPDLSTVSEDPVLPRAAGRTSSHAIEARVVIANIHGDALAGKPVTIPSG